MIQSRLVLSALWWLLMFIIININICRHINSSAAYASSSSAAAAASLSSREITSLLSESMIRHPFFPSAKATRTRRRQQRRETRRNTGPAFRQQQKQQHRQDFLSSAKLEAKVKTKKGEVDAVPNKQESAAATATAKTSTPLAKLAQSFQDHILIGHNSNNDLHTLRLLNACKELEKLMRQVGQRANAKEIQNNIQKVQIVYQKAPFNQRDTMRKLLEYEKYTLQIHQPNGLLKDPSAAIGFLWLRRSLEFQTALYQELCLKTVHDGNNKNESVDATVASLRAYEQTLQRNHGWKIRNLYTLALKASTPSRLEMMARLGGFDVPSSSHATSRTKDKPWATNSRGGGGGGVAVISSSSSSLPPAFGPAEERLVEHDMRHLLAVWRPLVARWKAIYHEMDLEDKRRV